MRRTSLLFCRESGEVTMVVVYTAGYQGQSIEDFVRRLVTADVEIVVDVRKLPLSRKRGFSKTAFKSILEENGIGYKHFPLLGMPDNLRKLRHDLPDNEPILDEYDRLLPELNDEVNALASIVESQRACLVCFEADPAQCHRSRLAKHLSSNIAGLSSAHVA